MANLKRLPLSAFDPRLREVILKGGREVVEIQFPNPQKARNFRNILTSYRARAKLEFKDAGKPELWEPLYAAIISTKPGNPSCVQLRPRLNEFDEVFERLEINPDTSPQLDHDPLAEFVIRNEEDPDHDPEPNS